MRRELFSLAVEEGEYFNDEQPKIESVSCPRGSEGCIEHLTVINNYFQESYKYHRNKDYTRSIESLKLAFEKSKEIQEPLCISCAEFFRATITQTLENIQDDLRKMSLGWFGTNRFQSSFKMASMILDEFRT